MAINMPSWNRHVDLSGVWDSHRFGELSHALSKVYWPWTYNIIRDDDSKEVYAHEGCKDDEVDITIPGETSVK